MLIIVKKAILHLPSLNCAMKINFEPNLNYQLQAISAVVDLFDGAPYVRAEDRIFSEVIENRLLLTPEQIIANRNKIIEHSEIAEPGLTDDLDFTIEMETGTGKTYVYLRTAFELHKNYGLSKFVIVVPSIAVREGVIKTLEMTQEHFKSLYNVNCRFFAYDSRKPTAIRNFAQSSALEIMVMNIQAFDTDDRIINQERDTNNGEPLIDTLKKTCPIVIMDEPQMGMDTENRVERITALNPLFKLRYSATHREIKNLIHQLTPFDAYNQKLVKTIEVLSVHEDNRQSNVVIDLSAVEFDKSGKKPPKAKLHLMKLNSKGEFSEGIVKVGAGDNLEEKTKNPAYHDWNVDRIWKDLASKVAKIKFGNGIELAEGERHGWDKETIFREQIRLAIGQHFAKRDKLKEQEVKVLSLFFIDRVANYVEEEGLIRRLFIEQYEAEHKKHYGKKPTDTDLVHKGYFAKTGKGDYTDSIASMSKNSEVFELIMKNKERLLSFDEPLQFVFSHSALGVGWDNPNVFQICTLNETESVIKKRQEIGRGLRICVNQDGNRVRDPEGEGEEEINVLTVVPNQSYHAFVTNYQDELAEEYGAAGRAHKPRDARRKPTKVQLNRQFFDSSDFDELWRRIAHKTKYVVHFDEETIINRCIEVLNSIVVPQHEISVDLYRVTRLDQAEQQVSVESEYGGSETVEASVPSVALNIVRSLSEDTSLSLGATTKIVSGLNSQQELLKNPLVFLAEAGKKIRHIMQEEMVRIVRYEALSDSWEKTDFKEMFETFDRTLKTDKSIYDHILIDSDIEERFAIDCNSEGRMRFFIKLPKWYTIDTPIGKYTPDWALAIEKRNIGDDEGIGFYFVVETKGTNDPSELRSDELAKIQCAVEHFKSIGLEEYFAPVDSLSALRNLANQKTTISF